MDLKYSFIIPVFNRPDEIKELLRSIWQLDYEGSFEVIIVEDGSTIDSRETVAKFKPCLNVHYHQKPNTGPGDSRNFGMRKAHGNYFIILDSDVLLPPNYLREIDTTLNKNFVHCFGGPDGAHPNFSQLQKAINYSMTSYLTTGGIRGKKQGLGEFQPRSFNMGISREAFEASGGFGKIHPGEDPDLALRLRKLEYETVLIPQAMVYHKRRIDWEKFYEQVYKFGLVRPILNTWHPNSAKMTYWFPTFFSVGFLLAVLLLVIKLEFLLYCFVAYFLLVFIHSTWKNRSMTVGVFSAWASLVQFLGYGLGFCRSTYYIRILKEDPEKRFPKLFFKHAR